MTTAIQPSGANLFLKETLLTPYTEGAERITRAIKGVNLHHIQHPSIPLLDRGYSLLVGLCLMIPLINSIVWICMKTFGNPEMLSAPLKSSLAPLEAADWSDEEEVEVVADPVALRGTPINSRSIRCRDVSNDVVHEHIWTTETHDEMFFVTCKKKDSSEFEIQATFDADWHQKKFYIKKPDVDISAERRGNSLSVDGTYKGEKVNKVLQLPNKPFPWIQQPQTGFQPYLDSKQNKLHFYGIHPESFEITECVANKEESHLEPFGRVIKVSFALNEGILTLLGPFHLSTCYFDPTNGDLLKMDYRLGLFAWGSSDIIRP